MPGAQWFSGAKINFAENLLRYNASPHHVPAKILSVPEIPYTLNMKKVELAVKKTIEKEAVLNKDALRNPKVLDYFVDLEELYS